MLSNCMKQIENNPIDVKQIPWYELPAERWRDAKHNRWCQRDSQKQKLYDAQSIAKVMHPLFKEKQLASLEAIQRYVNRFTKLTWFKTRFGEHHITVKKKKGSGADARKWGEIIRFSEHHRTIFTVLHEIAHIVHKDKAGSAHGRFYARTLIELIEHEFGKEATGILKRVFRKGKVKYSPKRVLSEKTREKLRQNFINNVLKQKVEV